MYLKLERRKKTSVGSRINLIEDYKNSIVKFAVSNLIVCVAASLPEDRASKTFCCFYSCLLWQTK